MVSFPTSTLFTAFLDLITFLDCVVTSNSVHGIIRSNSNPDCIEYRMPRPRIIRVLVPVQVRVTSIDLTRWASFEDCRLEPVSSAVPALLAMVPLLNLAIPISDDPGFGGVIRSNPKCISSAKILDRDVLRLCHINLLCLLIINVQHPIASNIYAETIPGEINSAPLCIV